MDRDAKRGTTLFWARATLRKAPESSLLTATDQREVLSWVDEGDSYGLAVAIAFRAQKKRDPEAVGRLMRWAIALEPAALYAFPYLMGQLLEGGRVPAARAMLARARKSARGRAPLFDFWEAKVLLAEGQLSKAQAICKRLLRRDSRDEEALTLSASIRARQGKPPITRPQELDFFKMLQMVTSGEVVAALDETPELARAISAGLEQCTLLHFAVEQRAHDAVKRLIASGADVDRRSVELEYHPYELKRLNRCLRHRLEERAAELLQKRSAVEVPGEYPRHLSSIDRAQQT